MADNANGFKELEKFASNSAGAFIKFPENGEALVGIYTGFYLEDDTFNPGQKRAVYKLEIDNEDKLLSSSSKRLAKAFVAAGPEVGQFVQIKRTGEGFDTDYTVVASDIPF